MRPSDVQAISMLDAIKTRAKAKVEVARRILKDSGAVDYMTESDIELVLRTFASDVAGGFGGYPYGWGSFISRLYTLKVPQDVMARVEMICMNAGHDEFYGPPPGYSVSAYDGQRFGD